MAVNLTPAQQRQRKIDAMKISSTRHADMTPEDKALPLAFQYWNAGFAAGLAAATEPPEQVEPTKGEPER